MNKLPASLMIGGRRIKLRFVENFELHGEYNHDARLIRLDAALLDDPKKLWSTLRHEMMEATLLISGIAWSERFESEPIVRAMEEIFLPAMDRLSKHFQ